MESAKSLSTKSYEALEKTGRPTFQNRAAALNKNSPANAGRAA
jgi:hypothetical protein